MYFECFKRFHESCVLTSASFTVDSRILTFTTKPTNFALRVYIGESFSCFVFTLGRVSPSYPFPLSTSWSSSKSETPSWCFLRSATCYGPCWQNIHHPSCIIPASAPDHRHHPQIRHCSFHTRPFECRVDPQLFSSSWSSFRQLRTGISATTYKEAEGSNHDSTTILSSPRETLKIESQ